jgi:hypothetical protein
MRRSAARPSIRNLSTTIRVYRMSTSLDLAYHPDRQAELRENLSSVQAEIDAVPGVSTSKVSMVQVTHLG